MYAVRYATGNVNALSEEFTAGPNSAAGSAGAVNFLCWADHYRVPIFGRVQMIPEPWTFVAKKCLC